MYTFFGKSSLFDIWGDFIVYRNLVPADQRLPAISQLRKKLSLQSPNLPRKTDPDYAHVVAEQLRQARRLDLGQGLAEAVANPLFNPRQRSKDETGTGGKASVESGSQRSAGFQPASTSPAPDAPDSPRAPVIPTSKRPRSRGAAVRMHPHRS